MFHHRKEPVSEYHSISSPLEVVSQCHSREPRNLQSTSVNDKRFLASLEMTKTPIELAPQQLLRAEPFPPLTLGLPPLRRRNASEQGRWQPELQMYQPLLFYLGSLSPLGGKGWPHTPLREYPSPQVLNLYGVKCIGVFRISNCEFEKKRAEDGRQGAVVS